MRYVRLTESDISHLEKLGVHELLVELLPDGSISREIGFDCAKIIIHRFPGEGRFGKYGILDNSNFDVGDRSDDVSPSDFESFYRSKFR
jgi:hypothetical protein